VLAGGDHETVMGIERKLGVELIGPFLLALTVGMAVATAGTLAPPAIGAVLMVTAAGVRWPRRVAEPRRPTRLGPDSHPVRVASR
jgi:hypothetical protein